MKTLWRWLVLPAFLLLNLSACDQDTIATDTGSAAIANERLEVIAYYHGDTSDIRKYAVSDLTQIIYSFLHLDGNQLAFDNDQQMADVRNLVALKESYPHLKILVAFGGWGGCETCSDVFSSEENQQAFADSARALLDDYDLDGIDLDWEYPAIAGFAGHAFAPKDKPNFTALVVRLRETLGSDYEISFAAGAGTKYRERAVDWQRVMPLVDRVNVMTYDLISDGTLAEHHTPMYSTSRQAASVDSAIQNLLNLGIDPKKIVLGAAFYARVWNEVEDIDGSALYQSARFKGFLAYREYAEYFASGCSVVWDDDAHAPFCYSENAGEFASFDDERSVADKVSYAREHGLGGIMFWQLAQDTYTNGLLDAISESLTSSLGTPAER